MADFLKHILIVGTGSSCLIGAFLALVFFRQKRKHPQTNLVMGLLLIALSCSVALNGFLDLVIRRNFRFLHTMPEPFLLLIGPLLFEYIQRLSGIPRSLHRWFFHLLPFVLVAAALVWMLTFANILEPRTMVWVGGSVWLGIYLHFWVYYFLGRKRLRQYQTELKDTRSSMVGVYPDWIHSCLNALLLFYTVLGVMFLLQHGHVFLPINRSLSYVVAAMIYWIAYGILLRPESFSHPPPQEPATPDAETSEPRQEKYRKSGLGNEGRPSEVSRIVQFMETEKPHLDPELGLNKLAAMLQLAPHHLSQLLNTGMKTNFYDFVNGYRVVEAKRMLSDEANRHLTLIHLAMESGFQSKATFNRMFKKITKQTPSQFRRRHTVPSRTVSTRWKSP